MRAGAEGGAAAAAAAAPLDLLGGLDAVGDGGEDALVGDGVVEVEDDLEHEGDVVLVVDELSNLSFW